MTQTFTYTFSTPANSSFTVTVADTPSNYTIRGTAYTGYAIIGITGTFDGQTITGLLGAGGVYNDDKYASGAENAGPYDNTIFINDTQGDGTSFDGIDNNGIGFSTDTGAHFAVYSDGANGCDFESAGVPGQAAVLDYTNAPCYCRGTLILTDRGEVAVEALAIGDTVVTASGRHRPIRWIGRREYAGRFLAANPGVQPILLRAGCLGDDLPRRDLRVSPKHAMFLDGLLVPAEHLVNGTTIVRDPTCERVEYFHVELDRHDVLLAEGAPSESYVDDDNRGLFHNAAECPAHGPQPAAYCAVRVESEFELEAIRRRIAGGPAGAAKQPAYGFR